MLPFNMIQSRQPRPATFPSARILPLSPFSHTDPPNLCLSPLRASTNSTHPTQLDTPVPPQPLCSQSYPHAFRHTWGCASVSTFNFELSTRHRSIRRSPHPCPHQCHSAPLSRPLFSYSSALFCTAQNAIFHLFISLRTLCTNHPGWGGCSFPRNPSFRFVAFAAINFVSLSLTAHARSSRLYPTLCLAPLHCYSSTNAEDPARTIPSSLGGQAGSPRGQDRFRFPTHQITKASQT